MFDRQNLDQYLKQESALFNQEEVERIDQPQKVQESNIKLEQLLHTLIQGPNQTPMFLDTQSLSQQYYTPTMEGFEHFYVESPTQLTIDTNVLLDDRMSSTSCMVQNQDIRQIRIKIQAFIQVNFANVEVQSLTTFS